MLEISLNSNAGAFKQKIDLEGIFYTFNFQWNSRMSIWSLDILTEAEDPIVQGLPIFVNLNVIERFKDSRLPPGKIYFLDTSGNVSNPLRFDLGQRVSMLYEESDE
jgi:hypothetical protein